MYFLKKEYATESVHAHELVHVVQRGELGLREFLFTYALGIAEKGYHQSPFESEARRVQTEFDAGRVVPDLLASVKAHARRHRDQAREIFRQHALRRDV